MEPKTKTTRAKFSDAEIKALLEGVEHHAEVILAKHDSRTGVTANAKQAAWDTIQQKVNAISKGNRSVKDIRKKFKDLRARRKSKVAAASRHEGGTG